MAAGLGFKTFTTGEVLTAADTNGYLMQGVLVFASAAARDAAVTSPQEGQCCYLKDTDAVQTYSGTAWVGFDDSNAIQNSIVDAKGDIVAASGNDTPARLAVGSNGDTLVADSSTATGLRWQQTLAAGRNFFINGGQDIWQRGTSFAVTSAAYTADRWQGWSQGPSSTVSRQATGDTTNLPQIQYCARVQRNSGQTLTNAVVYQGTIETANSIPLAGKTVTISFYARAGANFSATSSTLNYSLLTGTGTDQVLTAFTGSATPISATATLTTTWQRFQATATLSASTTEIGFQSYFVPVGTAGAADFYEITGIQLEVGSVATPFSRSGGTIQGELAACQRYYLSWVTGTTLAIGTGFYTAASTLGTTVPFPVTMRIAPSLVVATGTNYYNFERNSGSDNFNSFTIWLATPQSTGMYNNSEASGTAGQAGFIYTNNASASIAFSAEL